MRFLLLVLAITLYIPFLCAEETSFKLTFGGNLGKIPFEINKIKKTSSGIKMNSWVLSQNFLSYIKNKKNSHFLENKDFKEEIYIKLNFKF